MEGMDLEPIQVITPASTKWKFEIDIFDMVDSVREEDQNEAFKAVIDLYTKNWLEEITCQEILSKVEEQVDINPYYTLLVFFGYKDDLAHDCGDYLCETDFRMNLTSAAMAERYEYTSTFGVPIYYNTDTCGEMFGIDQDYSSLVLFGEYIKAPII